MMKCSLGGNFASLTWLHTKSCFYTWDQLNKFFLECKDLYWTHLKHTLQIKSHHRYNGAHYGNLIF